MSRVPRAETLVRCDRGDGRARPPGGRVSVRGDHPTSLETKRAGKQVRPVAELAIDAGTFQHPSDDVVKAVAQNIEGQLASPDEPIKLLEVRIDRNGINQGVELGLRSLHQRHLPLETLPGTNRTAYPLLLDFPPRGVSQLRQDEVRNVNLRNRSVKVAKNNRFDSHLRVQSSCPFPS